MNQNRNPTIMKTLILTLFAATALPAQAITYQIAYNHDAAGRLTAVNYNGASRTAYNYDKNGSLLSRINTVTPAPMPPPHLAGTYNGLITNMIPTAANMGSITLKLLGTGAFSGKFTLQGVSISFAGKFLQDGTLDNAPIVIDRAPPLTDFQLGLSLDVRGDIPRITGTLDGSGFSSHVMIEPALYNATTNLLPGGFVSKYTALFQPEMPAVANAPQSDGYATVTITSTGAVTLAGKLANNVTITHSSLIVGPGSWPLFVPMHANQGYIAGEVFFNLIPGQSVFEGGIAWLKPVTVGGIHTAAFMTWLSLIGSRYDAPLAGQRALDLLGTVPNATFTATGGNLTAPPLVRSVTLNSSNIFITPVDAAALKLTLTPSTGVLTGSFKDGIITRTLGGVLFQEGNFGSGFFPGTTVSGLVEIDRNP
jgi:YD repeat-containing protein